MDKPKEDNMSFLLKTKNNQESKEQEENENKKPEDSLENSQCDNSKIHSLVPAKGPWTYEEDRKLLSWISEHGAKKWSLCSRTIAGRTGKQCRERWFNALNPNVKKGEWNLEEDYKIFLFYEKYGGKWSKICTCFNNRTENSLKNRFYSTLRKINLEKIKYESKKNNDDITNSASNYDNLVNNNNSKNSNIIHDNKQKIFISNFMNNNNNKNGNNTICKSINNSSDDNHKSSIKNLLKIFPLAKETIANKIIRNKGLSKQKFKEYENNLLFEIQSLNEKIESKKNKINFVCTVNNSQGSLENDYDSRISSNSKFNNGSHLNIEVNENVSKDHNKNSLFHCVNIENNININNINNMESLTNISNILNEALTKNDINYTPNIDNNTDNINNNIKYQNEFLLNKIDNFEEELKKSFDYSNNNILVKSPIKSKEKNSNFNINENENFSENLDEIERQITEIFCPKNYFNPLNYTNNNYLLNFTSQNDNNTCISQINNKNNINILTTSNDLFNYSNIHINNDNFDIEKAKSNIKQYLLDELNDLELIIKTAKKELLTKKKSS